MLMGLISQVVKKDIIGKHEHSIKKHQLFLWFPSGSL